MKFYTDIRGIFATIAMAAGLVSPHALHAQSDSELSAIAEDAFFGTRTYRLWQGRAPGAIGDDAAETPTISVVTPREGPANGTAVVLAPGGGYVGLASGLEGAQVAQWFAARGVTAFVVKYRVGERARLPIPLHDGERAMRFVRAHAAEFGIDPARIGMMGFSAGGHLAATTAAGADDGNPASADPVERAGSRPDFLILGYPWLEGMQFDERFGTSQYCYFTRDESCDADSYARYLPLDGATADMPPTFIYHTTNDDLVPVEGSVRFYSRLIELGVSAEMHLFANGRHGTGLGGSDPALNLWPEALEEWMRAQELLPEPQLPPPPAPDPE